VRGTFVKRASAPGPEGPGTSGAVTSE
jgi:hypothetical protein